jgi:sugar lactone lactonase YvrE
VRTALSTLLAVLVLAALGSASATAATSAPHTAAVSATTTPGIVGTLSTASSSVMQGQQITFSYSIPASAVLSNNWIGIYSNPGCGPTTQAYDCASTSYNWVANASGTSSFSTSGLAAGNYIAYFLYDNGYTWLAQPVSFTVTAPPGTLSVQNSVVTQGQSLTFNYSIPAAKVLSNNWIGLYSNPGNGPVNQVYVGSSTTYNWIANASGTSTFSTTHLAPGNYIAYFLYDNGYTWLAEPVTFTVQPAAPPGTLTAQESSVQQGQQITFSYSIPAAQVLSDNWVGLYSNPGCGPVNQVSVCGSTTYNWVTNASGTTTFSTGSLAPGNYIAYFLYDNGYTWLAKPVTFTVTAVPPVAPPTFAAAFGTSLNNPQGIAVDSKNNVWVTDGGQNRVEEFSKAGKLLHSFTKSGAGRLNSPTAIAVDPAGHVYVADTGDNRVVEYSATGVFVRQYTTANGTALSRPQGVAVDAAGDLFVSDTGNSRVLEFGATGGYLKSLTSGLGRPEGLSLDATGDVYVADSGLADSGPNQVVELSPSNTVLDRIGSGTSSDLGGLSSPSDVALDASGHLFVTDPDFSLAKEFETDGPYLNEFGAVGPGELANAVAIAVAPDGQIYVADSGNGRIVEFTPAPAG